MQQKCVYNDAKFGELPPLSFLKYKTYFSMTYDVLKTAYVVIFLC